MFLTFNYTKTPEAIYNANNVCHIHGIQDEDQSILFGHNNRFDYFKENPQEFLGSEENLQNAHDMLRKNTKMALKNNAAFFNKIDEDVECIYSYGFSFSDIDMVYIERICQNLKKSKPIWYLNKHDDINRRLRYINNIKKYGFCGSFDTYKIIS